MSMIGLLQTTKDAARSIETAQATQSARLSGFRHLSRDVFLEVYSAAFEKAKLEARKKGYSASEQQLQDGSIQVRVCQI